ncbi:hypothetical protein A2911_00125 [Candidatus Nomurabacteria bacterium RIFCSPLOWO2_01_FULL_40_15]|uniref:Uncharacterized protein n=1 Tax=Candidatus Nomurabacteria bacterium RIFCSPLOWO2_01_FULL_40_15 TaxID=1801772 RepID=A0A1F6X8B7_9BACT|nr:MAG: hypothetical protein A2911_00125 [Candidatus Nomurabacteria bacterium RIFCSPLOWO2_01_FULL_40_15]
MKNKGQKKVTKEAREDETKRKFYIVLEVISPQEMMIDETDFEWAAGVIREKSPEVVINVVDYARHDIRFLGGYACDPRKHGSSPQDMPNNAWRNR